MQIIAKILAHIIYLIIVPFYVVFNMLAYLIPGSKKRAMQRAIDYIAKTGVEGFAMIEVVEYAKIDPADIYMAIREWLQQDLLSKFEIELANGSFQVRYIRTGNFKRKPTVEKSVKKLADWLFPKPIPQS